MNKEQVIETLRHKERSEQFDWVLHLGAELTVAARAAYPSADGKVERLVGFNEIQHRIFGWLRNSATPNDWPIERLWESLLTTAAQHGIERGFAWATERSLVA